jgi:hypothetical protein
MASEIPAIQPVGSASPTQPVAVPPANSSPGLPDPPDVGPSYEVDEQGTVIVKIVDRATHEIIREIPSQEVQRMNRALDALVGRVLDRRG